MYQYPASDYTTGLSMLVPLAFEPGWTALREGEVFNAYPPDTTGGVAPLPQDYGTTLAQTVPVPFTVSTITAVLPANVKRGYVLIQNNSVAGGTSDVLPDLFIAFDGPVSTTLPLGLNKKIPAGSGLVLDRNCPYNAIYVKWGTFTNTSGLAFAGGVIEQGLQP